MFYVFWYFYVFYVFSKCFYKSVKTCFLCLCFQINLFNIYAINQVPSKSLNYFKNHSIGDLHIFPCLLQFSCAFTEQILILLFRPLIYGYNDGYIVLKARMGGNFFLVYEQLEVKRSQLCKTVVPYDNLKHSATCFVA